MHITSKSWAALALATSLFLRLSFLNAQEESLARRIVTWSEGDQTAWINRYVAEGMPTNAAIGMLALNKSSLTLPILEAKIEEIIKAKDPRSLFVNQTISPNNVIGSAAYTIAYAGDQVALDQVAKLVKLDEKRFAPLISETLENSRSRRNTFTLAYHGLEIGDPIVSREIMNWVQHELDYKDESIRAVMLSKWTEALLYRYNGVPTKVEWANDAVVLHLKPVQAAALEYEMRTSAEERLAAQKKRLAK